MKEKDRRGSRLKEKDRRGARLKGRIGVVLG